VESFTRSFSTRYDRIPDPNAAQSYDAIMILGQAIEKAGVDEPAAIRDALAAMDAFNGVTGTITFDDAGDSPREMMVIVVRDGEYTLYE